MTHFLSTTGVSHQIEEIIKNAEERLWIISPFLKVTPRIKQLLEDTNRLKIDSRVIYGKNELQPEENNWLESMTSIRTSFCKDLHAKCYMNENDVLLTSMNLYEYSQINNFEMGILISREDDRELYNQICEEADRIQKASEKIHVPVARVPATENDKADSVATETRRQPRPALATPRRSQPAKGVPTYGFCIRCKADISANPKRPYCQHCYTSWNVYKNGEYEEKHCHTCGNGHKATLFKPLCPACYRKYKDIFEFAVS